MVDDLIDLSLSGNPSSLDCQNDRFFVCQYISNGAGITEFLFPWVIAERYGLIWNSSRLPIKAFNWKKGLPRGCSVVVNPEFVLRGCCSLSSARVSSSFSFRFSSFCPSVYIRLRCFYYNSHIFSTLCLFTSGKLISSVFRIPYCVTSLIYNLTI